MRVRQAAAALAAALLLVSCGGGDDDLDDGARPSSGPPTSTVSSSPAPSGPTTSTGGVRLTVPGGTGTGAGSGAGSGSGPTSTLPAVDLRPGGAPPWATAKIDSGTARRVGLDEWLAAANKDTARLVLPADVGLAAGAAPRRAIFTGGWAVAWDQSSGPGVEPTGAFCENCGRGVAGIAGTGGEATRSFTPPFTNVVEWNDGSAVGYTGPRSDSRQFLANLYVNGQASLYQVWSYISQSHLEYLISQLRFVEGAP